MINRLHVTRSCCNAIKRLGQNRRWYKAAKSESPSDLSLLMLSVKLRYSGFQTWNGQLWSVVLQYAKSWRFIWSPPFTLAFYIFLEESIVPTLRWPLTILSKLLNSRLERTRRLCTFFLQRQVLSLLAGRTVTIDDLVHLFPGGLPVFCPGRLGSDIHLGDIVPSGRGWIKSFLVQFWSNLTWKSEWWGLWRSQYVALADFHLTGVA